MHRHTGKEEDYAAIQNSIQNLSTDTHVKANLNIGIVLIWFVLKLRCLLIRSNINTHELMDYIYQHSNTNIKLGVMKWK